MIIIENEIIIIEIQWKYNETKIKIIIKTKI
jgi:hypothetical protein